LKDNKFVLGRFYGTWTMILIHVVVIVVVLVVVPRVSPSYCSCVVFAI
jgi:uncharacterized membrane protein